MGESNHIANVVSPAGLRRFESFTFLENTTMEQILEILKKQPKEVLQWIVLELMRNDKLSFADIAQMHVEYMEMLKKGQTEKLMHLRSQVIDLWCGTKKALPSKLVAIMQEGKDEGWVNITQEQIDNSKWNRL